MVTSAEPPVVTIDGPSGSGKSTVARGVAAALKLPHVDTGALYRAVTLAALRAGVDPEDGDAVAAIARQAAVERRGDRTYLDGQDVEDEIRGEPVTAAVSTVSAHPGVRQALVPLQRAAAVRGGVVEGRDIGTVVFPDAPVKLWLTAAPAVRAARRTQQLGGDEQLTALDLERRDAFDAGRAVAPLRRPEDAWEIDTSGMGERETVEAVAALVRALLDRAQPDEDPADPAQPTARRRGTDGADVRPSQPRRAPASRRILRGSLPRVAVLGRPNVGKSTLVNRILGRRTAIVEPRPGVTRDRTEHEARWLERRFVVIDTGGWEQTAEGLGARVAEQAEAALSQADLILFVVDATVGVQEDDEGYARVVRRADVPVLVVANKVDRDRDVPLIHELHALGLGDPHAVSALHGRGVGDLLDAVVRHLPPESEAADEPSEDVASVAIVGRPNVGKSSLFNAVLGQERALVDPVPHTTRDPVDTVVEIGGRAWRFVDTAGLRRRFRHGEDTERYSVDRTRRAVEAADLAVFVVDGSEPLGEQDQRLAALVRDAGCGVVLAVNKWDEVDVDRRGELERELDRLLRFADWAPRVNISARSRRGVERLLDTLEPVLEGYRTRVPTAQLNAWLAEATAAAPPPPVSGRTVRIRYVTQAAAAPPVFVFFTSGRLSPPYRRYLERSLRERYGFTGTPLRIEVRPSSRQDREQD